MIKLLFDKMLLKGIHMDLREYLFKMRISKKEFAHHINYAPGYIVAICAGRLYPGRKMAEVIEHVTEGLVKVDELMKPRQDKQI